MVFKKSGNSREDKPQRSSGRPAKSGDSPRSSSPRSGKTFSSGYSSKSTGKPYGDRAGKPERPYGSRSEGDKPYGDKAQGGSFSKPYGERSNKRSSASYSGRPAGDRQEKSSGDKPYGRSSEKSFGDKPFRGQSSDKPYNRRPNTGDQQSGDRPYGRSAGKPFGQGGFSKRPSSGAPRDKDNRGYTKSYDRPERGPRTPEQIANQAKLRGKKTSTNTDDGLIRLNRYISNAGICSRRKADELIEAGVVSVNGEVISELGHKVDPTKDVVRYNGETLKREKMVYVLLNKPKDYITTTDDPQERRTVMHLVEKASRERIYPVGRLDRNTTGLLLMTNDGDLADKLSHPKNNVSKLYMVELNKSLTQGDLNKIGFGLELEDGFIKPDSISYVAGGTKREVGIQIHSGRNRIVRRIFEHLGYEVEKLDRSVYANLTKKDLPRGRWRMLDEKEVIQLKHLLK
ncbi:pseudouridine synthase [Mucilaginibacter ginkgonis]|uniref:Pseudouridine synthase n=1 Tax=Mucilaginibacter ginkgonis TaxID=2682091 RepID=A0A6I4INP0_9SPHI|nr:pseudouridine synthase [Mucilaginibacter ginkgonis]QQL48933.1 rRNA pseudouridine synthase [Mucilaginibacter ginkgonis]